MLRSRLPGILLIAVLAIAAYFPSLDGEFLSDDLRFVVENRAIHELSLSGTIRYFTVVESQASVGASGIYRPLRTLDFAIDWAIAGNSPWFFRLKNLLYHILGAVLAWALFRRLADDRGPWAAAPLTGAVLFVLHPVHVESVAFVSSRGDLMCLCLVLGALILHLDGRRAVAAGVLLAALFAKETAVVFPALAWLADGFTGRPRPRPWRAYAGYAVLSVGFALLWIALVGASNPEGLGQRTSWPGGSWLLNLIVVGKGLLQYARELLFPVNILFDDYIPSRNLLAPGSLILAGLGFATVVAALVAGRRTRFAALWFLALLLPVSGVIVPLSIPTAERWLLLPAVGVCFAAGTFLAPFRLRFVVFLCFFLLTMSQSRNWRSMDALAGAALARSPTPLALGQRAYRQLQQLEETRRPEDALFVLETVDAFFRLYREEIDGPVPADFAVRLLQYRAVACLHLDRPTAALEACEQALEYGDADWTVHDAARAARLRLNRTEDAVRSAEAAFELQESPVTRRRLAETLFLLGWKREQQGQRSAARDLYSRSWSLLPDPDLNRPARQALDRLR